MKRLFPSVIGKSLLIFMDEAEANRGRNSDTPWLPGG